MSKQDKLEDLRFNVTLVYEWLKYAKYYKANSLRDVDYMEEKLKNAYHLIQSIRKDYES